MITNVNIQETLINKLVSNTTGKIVSAILLLPKSRIKITTATPIALSPENKIQIEDNLSFVEKYKIISISDAKTEIIFENIIDGVSTVITEAQRLSLIDCNVIYGSSFSKSLLTKIPSKQFPVFVIDVIGRNTYPNNVNSFIPTEGEFMAMAMFLTDVDAIESTRNEAEISLSDMMSILQVKVKDQPLFNATIYENKRIIMVGCTFEAGSYTETIETEEEVIFGDLECVDAEALIETLIWLSEYPETLPTNIYLKEYESGVGDNPTIAEIQHEIEIGSEGDEDGTDLEKIVYWLKDVLGREELEALFINDTLVVGDVYVTSITIDNEPTEAIAKDETYQLEWTVLPINTTDKTVTFESSDTDVATVSATGLVTIIGEGDATITITSNQVETITDTAEIEGYIAVTSVSITNKPVEPVQSGFTFTYEVLPIDATDKTITWLSSDTDVATIDENGELTILSDGTITITLKSQENEAILDTTEVECITAIPVTSVTLDKSNIYINNLVGQTIEGLVATVLPVDADDKSVEWLSSDTNIATVTSTGDFTANVTYVGQGEVTITCRSVEDNEILDTCLALVTDRTALALLITEAQALTETDWSPASWSNMQGFLTTAISVRDNEESTQSEVDTAKDNLQTAIEGLTVDKTALQSLIDGVAELDEEDYTPTSWTALENEVTVAEGIVADDDATQDEIDAEVITLGAAITSLELLKLKLYKSDGTVIEVIESLTDNYFKAIETGYVVVGNQNVVVKRLVQGGGGAGGNAVSYISCGGGGGGRTIYSEGITLLANTRYNIAIGSYSIGVGNYTTFSKVVGETSELLVKAMGGGIGGSDDDDPVYTGGDGGSGGGGSNYGGSGGNAICSIPPYDPSAESFGNVGGTGEASGAYGAGGGGGANGTGNDGNVTIGGDGGEGKSLFSGIALGFTSNIFGSGGGGGSRSGVGGVGGTNGGSGGSGTANGTDAIAGTGAGGGGATSSSSTSKTGGKGASGCIIISYQKD